MPLAIENDREIVNPSVNASGCDADGDNCRFYGANLVASYNYFVVVASGATIDSDDHVNPSDRGDASRGNYAMCLDCVVGCGVDCCSGNIVDRASRGRKGGAGDDRVAAITHCRGVVSGCRNDHVRHCPVVPHRPQLVVFQSSYRLRKVSGNVNVNDRISVMRGLARSGCADW